MAPPTHKHFTSMSIRLTKSSDLITTLTYLKANHANLIRGKFGEGWDEGYVEVRFEESTQLAAEAKEQVLRAQFFNLTFNEKTSSPRIPPNSLVSEEP